FNKKPLAASREAASGRRSKSLRELEIQPIFHADQIFIPNIAGQGATVADVDILTADIPWLDEFADAKANADLGVDDGFAGGIDDWIRKCRVGFLAAQHAPANKLHDRRGAEPARIQDLVTDADAVTQHVALKIRPTDRDPVLDLRFQGQ